jgi:hypothetical protein
MGQFAPSMVTPALIRAQMGLARRPGAGVASAAFVPVDLEPVQESNWCFNRPEGSTAHCRWSWPAAAPPRSIKEMEVVAWVADQLNVLVHQQGEQHR